MRSKHRYSPVCTSLNELLSAKHLILRAACVLKMVVFVSDSLPPLLYFAFIPEEKGLLVSGF